MVAGIGNIYRRKIYSLVLNMSLKLGIFNGIRAVTPSVLTVLNYHRIDDVKRPGFDTFAPNVSASPAEFARQMDYLSVHYNVITCEHLNAWRLGKKELPTNPALITFDDGYYDNFANAYPILRERGLPAVIFLATDFIDSGSPFYWDYAAYCFSHTSLSNAELPILGWCSWLDNIERNRVLIRWLDSIKRIPEFEKKEALAVLPAVLGVDVPRDMSADLHLTWDHIREMSRNGIEMGAHTVTHPILTRIHPSQVEDELVRSKRKIESEINKPVISFAYPNGQASDFSPGIVSLVEKAGYDLAFTLVDGTTRYKNARENPLTIRRIYIGRSDVLPRFIARLSLGRFVN